MLKCKVDMDTRDTYDGEWVELDVSREAKPGRPGYGRLHTKKLDYYLALDLPYVAAGKRAAKLTDGRVLYLTCNR
tara:strand:+ start:1680 stop:1904 length:225 start_codon:yes stop_codon:yes gene_type:complete